MAAQQPEDQFIFLLDQPFDEKIFSSGNITPVAIGQLPKNNLLLQYRLNYFIPALLRKHKATVFISTGCISLRTNIPQCLIINDLSFFQQPQFYKKNIQQFLSKTAAIVSSSRALQQKLISDYAIVPGKIDVAYHGISENFKPLNWQQKDNIKANFSRGLEYFLYSGPIHARQNLITLLKAFSFFKKRQKSNMQLLMVSTQAGMDATLIKSLASYKYRDDVKLINTVPDDVLAKITAAAYASIYPSVDETNMTTAIQAFKAETPLIISRNTTTEEIAGAAALYIDQSDYNDIADKMMVVFKDEDKRNELIIKGRQQADHFHWEKTDLTMRSAVIKAVNRPII